MLHEVLLALSGHPSPLFGSSTSGQEDDFPLLSPSEQALLQSIGRLSETHRKLKRHLDTISSTHDSIICRAIATSIQQTHLSRFQKKIVDLESRILKKDATLVGAYEIVPLAAVVSEFDDWHRLMSWYWEIAYYMLPTRGTSSPNDKCTSALIIDKLRSDTQTGYPEIEAAAKELARVAETAWLRQLSSWVIYGWLPVYGTKDFFIQADGTAEKTFIKNRALLPGFVTSSTATSILFIGKSLHQVENYRRLSQLSTSLSAHSVNDSELASTHLQHLSSLTLPVIPSAFSRAIADIRLSLSQNVLQHLLPVNATVQLLDCLRQFLLLGRGNFAVALINEAEDRVQTRQENMGRLLAQDPVKALQGLSIKDSELNQTLRQVWRSLAGRDAEDEDEALDYAESHVSLVNAKSSTSRPSTSDSFRGQAPDISPTPFNNLLFPNPTELTITAAPPMDLFLSSEDMSTYSSISSYLLAIRRGHQRLSDLWKRTSARRSHPVPPAGTLDPKPKNNQRNFAMRKVWATCSAAHFLLSETAAFFEGEVIRGSCEQFKRWVEQPPPDPDESTVSAKLSDKPTQRDPETLASGHRAFLAALVYAVLLSDIEYTRALRSLLGNVDNFIAFFVRLLDLQQKLDLENLASGESAHTAAEEQRISLELDRARKKVDSDLETVVNRLRQLDQDRLGAMRYLDLGGDFQPWKGGGVDRLLMKLEFGRMAATERRDLV